MADEHAEGHAAGEFDAALHMLPFGHGERVEELRGRTGFTCRPKVVTPTWAAREAGSSASRKGVRPGGQGPASATSSCCPTRRMERRDMPFSSHSLWMLVP